MNLLIDERETKENLLSHTRIFNADNLLKNALNAMITSVIILNKYRQIVFANQFFLKWLDIKNLDSVVGVRPGEAFNCIYPCDLDLGCGNTEFCSQCGAKAAIMEAIHGNSSTKECRITRKLNNELSALDLRIHSNPFQYGVEEFTIFTCVDISNEKRRKVLERVFFHDILNLAGGLQGYTNLLLRQDDPVKSSNYKQIISKITEGLIEEINSHRDLLHAENKDLSISKTRINTIMFLRQLYEAYKNNPAANEKDIVISPLSENISFISDISLLRRVIGNMIKNALEAISKGNSVTIGAKQYDNGILFWVHNPTYIPKDNQIQIFKRSFSTKANNRGVGTYSMQLFTEEYLKGKVYFESKEKEGTTFMAWYPFEI
ncbi:MAG: HAMP domain-containing histidine kinase [Desulfobacterales bacterium]|nr:HAMP domain-containing histidine kinase [Desulfobacterales bacterium]MBF0395331.1 HAMP domain-containing histidine kinase [Desulfobacterales bacterium]